ncbi:MAG: OmpA family protein [Bdellovibrionales bacterium]|nr:OmpA family protein [Bdellovibrionales bacterium]
MAEPAGESQGHKKKKKHKDSGDGGHGGSDAPMVHDESNWLVSYADMMTLLFGFFVLMFAFSRIDQTKFTIVRKELAKHFGGKVKDNPAAKKAKDEIERILEGTGLKSTVALIEKDGEIELRFQGNVLFKSGTAEVLPASLDVLGRMINVIRERLTVDHITVEGHTDDEPIYSTQFPSNWELSAARASRVVREFEEAGFASADLKAEGFGSSRPIQPNRDATGKPMPQNQEMNRRVLVRIGFVDKLQDAVKALQDQQFDMMDDRKDLDVDTGQKPPTFDEIQGQQMDSARQRLSLARERLKDAEKKIQQVDRLEDVEKQASTIEKQAREAEIKAYKLEKELQKKVRDSKPGAPPKGGDAPRRKRKPRGK